MPYKKNSLTIKKLQIEMQDKIDKLADQINHQKCAIDTLGQHCDRMGKMTHETKNELYNFREFISEEDKFTNERIDHMKWMQIILALAIFCNSVLLAWIFI